MQTDKLSPGQKITISNIPAGAGNCKAIYHGRVSDLYKTPPGHVASHPEYRHVVMLDRKSTSREIWQLAHSCDGLFGDSDELARGLYIRDDHIIGFDGVVFTETDIDEIL